LWFKGDVIRAHRVVANSRGTAQRISKLLMRTADDIVMPGLEASFRPLTPDENQSATRELDSMGVRPPYLLSVSTLEPRKNIGVLVDAFIELKRHGKLSGFKLVLVGASGWKRNAKHDDSRTGRDDILETGYVPGHLLPALYANAEVFILPSLYEGFGMPALEARACGARIVVSDTPELRDAGGPNAVFIEPTSAGVREGIERALVAPRVLERGLCEDHAWSRAAAQLANTITSTTRDFGRKA
jgi:glycosyltransferase involved in cell wall biosynthesis